MYVSVGLPVDAPADDVTTTVPVPVGAGKIAFNWATVTVI